MCGSLAKDLSISSATMALIAQQQEETAAAELQGTVCTHTLRLRQLRYLHTGQGAEAGACHGHWSSK